MQDIEKKPIVFKTGDGIFEEKKTKIKMAFGSTLSLLICILFLIYHFGDAAGKPCDPCRKGGTED